VLAPGANVRRREPGSFDRYGPDAEIEIYLNELAIESILYSRAWMRQWNSHRLGHSSLTARSRGEVERRFAPRKVEVAVQRFEVNPSKPELVRFLNEHAQE
jgi:hypothetical protein